MGIKEIVLHFIIDCDRQEITPDETHIDSFLDRFSIRKVESIRNSLIRFSFYHWDNRNDKEFMAQLLGLS